MSTFDIFTLALVALSKVWPLSRMGASWSWAAPNMLFSSLLLLWLVPMERWIFDRWRCWDFSCCCCWYRRRGLGPGPFWRNHHQKKSRITPLSSWYDDSDDPLQLRPSRLNHNCKWKNNDEMLTINPWQEETTILCIFLSFYLYYRLLETVKNEFTPLPPNPSLGWNTLDFRFHFRIVHSTCDAASSHTHSQSTTHRALHQQSPWGFMLNQ